MLNTYHEKSLNAKSYNVDISDCSKKLKHTSAFDKSGSETCSSLSWYLGESDTDKSYVKELRRAKNGSHESSEPCCFFKQVKDYISETATHILVFLNLASHAK